MVKKDSLELAKENYTEYSKYVAQGRAYPCITDGLKSSYKRAIYGMYKNNTHKIVKVAELSAHALPYHPHPTSISGVIVQLGEDGNKLKLMETQGNWGNSKVGISASAERYIGGYLSPLAESLLCDSVEYCNYIKGEIEKDEPEALPALLPLCFINGSEGIPSGLPKLTIPTVDILGMVDYYVNILEHKSLTFKPRKFPKPNYDCEVISDETAWNQIMETGKGTLKLAPIMRWENESIIIDELPGSKNADSVHKILEKEFLNDKIDIRDESTNITRIVIERVPHKQIDMEEIYSRLYDKLQSNIICNMAFFDQEKIYVPCGFHSVVKANLQYLIDTHRNRISHQINDLKLKLKVLEIIELLKKGDNLKKLVDFDNNGAVQYICDKYKVEKDIASKVMQKPLSYLTKEHSQELIDLKSNINDLENDDRDIYEFLIKKYKDLRKILVKELNKRDGS